MTNTKREIGARLRRKVDEARELIEEAPHFRERAGVDARFYSLIAGADPIGKIRNEAERIAFETALDRVIEEYEKAHAEEEAQAGPPIGDMNDPIDAIAAAALGAEDVLRRVRGWMIDRVCRGVTSSPREDVAEEVRAKIDEILIRIEDFRKADAELEEDLRGVVEVLTTPVAARCLDPSCGWKGEAVEGTCPSCGAESLTTRGV